MNKNVVIQGLAIAALTILFEPAIALASLDDGGMRIFNKLAGVGKWAIAIKGSIDVIQSALNGDYQAAKTQFLGYLLCFALLLAIPLGLNEVESAFKP